MKTIIAAIAALTLASAAHADTDQYPTPSLTREQAAFVKCRVHQYEKVREHAEGRTDAINKMTDAPCDKIGKKLTQAQLKLAGKVWVDAVYGYTKAPE